MKKKKENPAKMMKKKKKKIPEPASTTSSTPAVCTEFLRKKAFTNLVVGPAEVRSTRRSSSSSLAPPSTTLGITSATLHSSKGRGERRTPVSPILLDNIGTLCADNCRAVKPAQYCGRKTTEPGSLTNQCVRAEKPADGPVFPGDSISQMYPS